MATIHLNESLNATAVVTNGKVWEASNGATRRTLVVVNKADVIVGRTFEASIGFLDKGNHSFIFLNPPKEGDKRVLGLFLNNRYGYSLVKGRELYTASSHGGAGNSESKFGVYEVGTVLEVHTYKNRQSPTYYELTANGWEARAAYEVSPEEVVEVEEPAPAPQSWMDLTTHKYRAVVSHFINNHTSCPADQIAHCPISGLEELTWNELADMVGGWGRVNRIIKAVFEA